MALGRPRPGTAEPPGHRPPHRPAQPRLRPPARRDCVHPHHLDDHSRLAYSEICGDETRETAVSVLRNAASWFAARGVRIERILSDNRSCYRSKLWAQACAEPGITPKRTRPYRPQTNGKIERFHRTLATEWAHRKFYASESARRAAFPAWLHKYNHHRPHTAIGQSAPITRLTNVPGQYS